ncbi:hypothetical protein NicSoilC12_13710 [Arthrobacter sp. NicSoilC12]|nr:hypothetical protein NicSoilC12_13710 [Arthrobacter sp. NicSoilC12]
MLAAGEQSAVDGTARLADGARQLDDGAGELEDGARTASDGAATLASELDKGAGKIPNPDDAQKNSLSKVIADPVAVSDVSQAKAASYGAGLAPFFLTLALWIGVFMLVQAMRPITQRALASNARHGRSPSAAGCHSLPFQSSRPRCSPSWWTWAWASSQPTRC